MAHRGLQRIFHLKKKENFTIIDNALINNKNLSWEARMVLLYLLSKPPDWIVRRSDIIRHGPAGRDMVTRMLKELEREGYLVRRKVKRANGTFAWETRVFELPLDEPRAELLIFEEPADEGDAGVRGTLGKNRRPLRNKRNPLRKKASLPG